MNAIAAHPIYDPSLPPKPAALDLGPMTARLATLIKARFSQVSSAPIDHHRPETDANRSPLAGRLRLPA